MMAPAGAGTPVKKLPAQIGLFGIVRHHVEAREPQAHADREDERGDPAGAAQFVQAPEIQDEPGHHAEIDEVGKAVEFGAEFRLALEKARQPPVDAVENGGEHDGAERPFQPAFDRKADRGQPRAKRKQRDDIRRQDAHGNGAETAAACFKAIGIERWEQHELYIASSARPRHASKRAIVNALASFSELRIRH